MSWANVRGAMVDSIEALTPSSRAHDTYRNVDVGMAEEQPKLRGFDMRVVTGPAQVGQIVNGTEWRWLTSCEVIVYYPRLRSRATMEQLISEDVVQLQQTLLQLGNHHANVEGIVPDGEGYITPSWDYDEVGNAVVAVPLTIHHL